MFDCCAHKMVNGFKNCYNKNYYIDFNKIKISFALFTLYYNDVLCIVIYIYIIILY